MTRDPEWEGYENVVWDYAYVYYTARMSAHLQFNNSSRVG